MPWIEQIPIEKATGFLKKQFEAIQVIAYYINHIVDPLNIEMENLVQS